MDTSFKNSVLFQQKSSISQVYDKSNQKKSGKCSNWFFFKEKKIVTLLHFYKYKHAIFMVL